MYLCKVPADGFNALKLHCAVLLYVNNMWWTQRIASKHHRCPNTFLKNWNMFLLKKFLNIRDT